jgi:threonine dehydratase
VSATSDSGNALPVRFADVLAARRRIGGLAVRTPLLESDLLNARVGGRVLVKPEPLQRTGSFKFRGACNAVAALRPKAVVAYSSGNHAQGVALAARLHGIPAVIVMPEDAPEIKKTNTRAYGAEVRLYDRYREEREAIGEAIARERGATLIRPYDEPLVIAGQGTVGLEIAEDCLARGLLPHAVLSPCGGGGLVAGIATAVRATLPGTEIWAVEPEGFDDTRRSLLSGRRERVAPGAASICDALLAAMPGDITFAINRRLLAGGLAVPDAAVEEAIRVGFSHLHVTVEPGGAVALAAVLAGIFPARDRTVVVVLSGGNVDSGLFARILAGGSA